MDTFIQIGLVTSFLLHGVLKNFVIGGIPILLVTYWRGQTSRRKDYYWALARGMSALAPVTMMYAVGVGFLAWGMVSIQYEWKLTSYFGSSGSWIVLFTLLLFALWGVVMIKRDGREFSGRRLALGGLVISCLLGMTGMFVLSHIEMFTGINHVETVPIGVSSLGEDFTFWPRYLHTVLSSLAVTGVALMVYGTLRPQCREDRAIEPAPYDTRLVRYGAGWTLGGTVPQVVVGPWFVLALPHEVRFQLIDGTTVVSLIFFVSLTLTLLSLVLLNSSLMIPEKLGLVWGGVGSLILTIIFMVLIREEVRKMAMGVHGVSNNVGELSWLVVMGLVSVVFVGLFLCGRYVTLSAKETIEDR